MNSRLFTVVRDMLSLTYNISFEVMRAVGGEGESEKKWRG